MARAWELVDGEFIHHGNIPVTGDGYDVEAKDLRVGGQFLDANGKIVTLQQSCRTEYKYGVTVYNFEVAGNHNYFVIAAGECGQTCILVHNANGTVYRALANGENPANGLTARNPLKDNTPASHVNGKKESQWISTTKNREIAEGKYNGGNGVVEIDLSQIPDENVFDASSGIQDASRRVNNYARSDQEVLIRGSVPPESVKVIREAE